MAEGAEKSIKERIKETRMERAIEIEEGVLASSGVRVCTREEHVDIDGKNIKEHIEECLGEMLYSYIEDERNYVLDGAVISCDMMSDEPVYIKFREENSEISIAGVKPIPSDYKKPADIGPERYNYEWEEYKLAVPVGEKNIRKLHTVSGNSQSDNGIRFATTADRSYLREKEEQLGLKSGATSNVTKAVGAGIRDALDAAKENLVSIVSLGNCKNIKEEDIKKIAENWDGVRKYGTCYALMQLASSWINPRCMESVVGDCNMPALIPICVVNAHHKPMKFDTAEGAKEGLTMMSTLLCGKEGIITIEVSGQVYAESKIINDEIGDIEERIERLVNSVEGKLVKSSEKLKALSTMEILSRLIYQEDRGSREGQNAVLFSIVNRLFSTGGFVLDRKNNNIYSVIVDSGQYASIKSDTEEKEGYSGFRPPVQTGDDGLEKEIPESEKEAWENAKRLAAILYIAIEDYGEPCKYHGENEREENVVKNGDDETYQEVISFIQQQKNIKGDFITNKIGTRDSFQGYETKRYGEEKHGGNYFNWFPRE